MLNKKRIYFVTTNKDKVANYKKRLAMVGWKLVHLCIELPETRDYDCQIIAQNKLKYALKSTNLRPLFVEDRGFEVQALNDFPKSHVKDLTNLIGLKTIYPLIQKNNSAKFTYAIAFSGKTKKYIFSGEEKGFMLPSKERKPSLKDVFCYYLFPNTPLSSLSPKQKNIYDLAWTKDDALEKLISFLKLHH